MAAELATTLTATDEERLEQAEALVRGYCGWHIAPSREETVTIRARCGRDLFLPSLHVTAVESVTDDGSLLAVEDDYRWTGSGVLTRGYWSDTEVVVEFTHGYAEVPEDVEAVVQAIARRAVDNPGSLVRETEGPFSRTYSTNENAQYSPLTLLDSEKEALRRYRLPVVG